MAQRSDSASIAASSSLTTFFMRIRLEWKVKRSGRICRRALSMAGISVSIVVFELGTIWPIRYVFCMILFLLGFERSELEQALRVAVAHQLACALVQWRLFDEACGGRGRLVG